MQLKTFQAADIRTALAAVKQELGAEALVVATRTIPGGLLSSPRVEITAAIETPSLRLSMPESKPMGQQGVVPTIQHVGHLNGERRYADSRRTEKHAWAAGLDENLKKLANSFAAQLTEADVEPDIAQRLGSLVARRCGADADSATYTRTLTALVSERLGQVSDPCRGTHVRLAMVGATGVGKTTTIAKLAAHAALIQRKQVALISVDTYRVGALEQLRAYADLIQVPLTIARDATSFSKALRAHPQADLVLIDTAGRGPQDAEQVPTLAGMFAEQNIRTCLAIAVGTRRYEMRRVLERYRPLAPCATIFTKLDESAVGGAMLNAVAGGSLPLSYVTFGQRVPEDIARADTMRLAEFITTTGEATAAFESWEGMVTRIEEEPS